MDQTAVSESAFVHTPARWFLRGFLAGVLGFAALNALSYFFRSQGGGNLLGTSPLNREAIGFPLQVWEEGNTYGGYFADYRALLLDVLAASIVGALVGILTVRQRHMLNRMVRQIEVQSAGREYRRFQFSLRSLLAATGIVALLAASIRILTGRPQVLAAIYVFGPWGLVLLALAPRGIHWQHRVVIVAVAAVWLILAAVAVGTSLGREFDQVLLGIFVCWTPQSALAALALTLLIIYAYRRQAPD